MIKDGTSGLNLRKGRNYALLMTIAKRAGLYSEYDFTTTSLSKELGISQQSISRKLRELESDDRISRLPSPYGTKIKLLEKGISDLRKSYIELKDLFSKSRKLPSITGIVVSGLGEGRFYTELPGYKKQIVDRLCMKAYPGTLNLRVTPELKGSFLSARRAAVIIDGFSAKDRSYGALECYEAVLSGIRVFVIVPDRTSHMSDTIEVISAKFLRKALKLKDGDKVVLR